MDLDKTKKPRSEDEERVWMQYSDTLLRTAERLRFMEKRKGLEVGFRVHRMALAMIKSDGWLKYWMFRNTIWETLKYTVYYLGERMDRMGREEKDIKLLWRLDLLQYYVHLYESQGRRTAAYRAKIDLGIEQKKAEKKAEKGREEEAEEEKHFGETKRKLVYEKAITTKNVMKKMRREEVDVKDKAPKNEEDMVEEEEEEEEVTAGDMTGREDANKVEKKAEKRREEEEAEEKEHAGQTKCKLELLDSDEDEVKKRMEDRVKDDEEGDKEGEDSAAEKINQRLERLTLQDHNYYRDLNVEEDEKRAAKKQRLDELKRDWEEEEDKTETLKRNAYVNKIDYDTPDAETVLGPWRFELIPEDDQWGKVKLPTERMKRDSSTTGRRSSERKRRCATTLRSHW